MKEWANDYKTQEKEENTELRKLRLKSNKRKMIMKTLKKMSKCLISIIFEILTY